MVRFTPGCNCCTTCELHDEDQFNRSNLGAEWSVASGSWTCNGSQLTGSGAVHWQPSGGLFVCCRIKLDSGTLKLGGASDPTTYFQFGDGKMSLYESGALSKQVAGWPSTGVFKFCTRADLMIASSSCRYAVSSGSNYDVFYSPAFGAFIGGYLQASATVTVDWLENFDCPEDNTPSEAELDCCDLCPVCEANAPDSVILTDYSSNERLLDTAVSGSGSLCNFSDLTWEVYFYDAEGVSGWDEKYMQAREVSSGQWYLGSDSINNCANFSAVTLTEQSPLVPPAKTITVESA